LVFLTVHRQTIESFPVYSIAFQVSLFYGCELIKFKYPTIDY